MNHWAVVVRVHRRIQPLSHISAAVERRTLRKMIAKIRAISKLCTARTGPKERPCQCWVGRIARRMLTEMAA
ncbi:hypothetical protein Bca52824_023945 [Brassica carinata]|uniref:Uncharacterized protein n=1 Tax=Brassica carinata TaxID=52824 RepID=A0A8X7VJP8_BRACI|nr:hypothetical protein Bca52824_023945 [Brassica carinata]